MKFVQITDTHIVPPGEKLYDLEPRERLDACIADIDANHRDAKLCIITGDLADHGKLEAYENLKEALTYLELPYHLLISSRGQQKWLATAARPASFTSLTFSGTGRAAPKRSRKKTSSVGR